MDLIHNLIRGSKTKVSQTTTAAASVATPLNGKESKHF